MGSACAKPTARHTLWARWVLQDGREPLQRDPRASVTNHLSPITSHSGLLTRPLAAGRPFAPGFGHFYRI
jgi:hypothetical protein